MDTHPEALLSVDGVSRTYRRGTTDVPAVTDVTFGLERGEVVALEGPSGAGKSTLLHLVGLLGRPDRGTILLDGRPVHDLSEPERTELRLHRIGVVTQHVDLIPELDAAENVAVPAILAGSRRGAALAAARELLEQVGMADRARHRPEELSGGEQQRVAIARALMNGPDLVIADEPTGNLDSYTGDQILGTLRALTRTGVAVLLATHDVRASAHADRTIRLVDGRIRPP